MVLGVMGKKNDDKLIISLRCNEIVNNFILFFPFKEEFLSFVGTQFCGLGESFLR